MSDSHSSADELQLSNPTIQDNSRSLEGQLVGHLGDSSQGATHLNLSKTASSVSSQSPTLSTGYYNFKLDSGDENNGESTLEVNLGTLSITTQLAVLSSSNQVDYDQESSANTVSVDYNLVEPQPVSQLQSASESQPAPEITGQTELDAVIRVDSAIPSEVQPATESQADSEAQPEPNVQPEIQPEPGITVQPATESEPELEPTPEISEQPDFEADSEAQPEPNVQPEIQPEPGITVQPATESEPETPVPEIPKEEEASVFPDSFNPDIISDPDNRWELVFSDEFNGDSLDRSKWNTTYYYGSRTNTWNNEEQYYVDDALQFENGVMSIVAEKQSIPLEAFEQEDIQLLGSLDKSTAFNYTSGIISGHDKYGFTHGYMEIKAKVPSGQSLWPAFWMLPTSGEWPPEIDIMEMVGQHTDGVITTMHYTDENSLHQQKHAYTAFPEIDFSSGFHTFAAEWTEETITWFVDGEVIYSVSNEIASQPMYLLANLAVGGSLPGETNATTPNFSSFDIDYIRVYQNENGTLHGGDADDQLSREFGNLAGEAGHDVLIAGAQNNKLIGGSGNDSLDGGSGDDVLLGTDAINLGLNEIDTLNGGKGADIFQLGNAGNIFYRDADSFSVGDQDYARILDFNPMEDRIELFGLASSYTLSSSGGGQSTALWFQEPSGQIELIAILEQTQVSDFSQGFSWVPV